jgi:hypothetical protein
MKPEQWDTSHASHVEHSGKHPTIPNSAHRKPSTVFFNTSSGTTITEAVHIQHIGICENVRHFAQHYYDVTFTSHNGPLTHDADSHASDSGAVRWEERTTLGAKSNYCIVKYLYRENRSE